MKNVAQYLPDTTQWTQWRPDLAQWRSKIPDYQTVKNISVDDIKSQMTWQNFYRAYNGAIAGFALYEYFTNPSAAFLEYLPDIGIHAFEALYADQQHSLAMTLNVARAGVAMNGFLTGLTTISSNANLFDVGLHALNSFNRFGLWQKEQQALGEHKKPLIFTPVAQKFVPIADLVEKETASQAAMPIDKSTDEGMKSTKKTH